MELLDIFLTSPEDQPDEYSVRYTSDAEHTYAHVQVVAQDEGVRMLFQWDDQDGWKYHDTQLMPFPPTSHPTLEQATAGSSTVDDEVLKQPMAAAATIAADPGNEDDYWNAYGVPSEDSISALPPRNAKHGSSDGAEDAYWAQYSSVQGDSYSDVFLPHLTPLFSQDLLIPRCHLLSRTIGNYSPPLRRTIRSKKGLYQYRSMLSIHCH
jgi:hypothetical protein